MGAIYLRGNTYWLKYYRNGKPYRESSKSTKEMVAKRLPKLREGQIVEGKFPGLQGRVSEAVAMKVSGHKTRSVFDRYNVTDENDLQHACESVSKLDEENRAAIEQAQEGHNLDTIPLKRVSGRESNEF